MGSDANGPSKGDETPRWQRGIVSPPGLDDRGDVFFAAVEMSRKPMIGTDPNQPDNPIVFANNALLDLTGYRTEEVAGRNRRFLQGARTDRETVRDVRDAIAERRPVQVEILNCRRDGTPFWNGLFVGPVFDDTGQLLHFFSQLDVTRRRSSEDAFRQAQKMEAVGQLTAGLAHDFSSMLQVIGGNLRRVESVLAAADPAGGRGGALPGAPAGGAGGPRGAPGPPSSS